MWRHAQGRIRRQGANWRLTVAILGIVLIGPARSQEAPTLAKQARWVTAAAFTSDGSQLFTGGGESLLYRPGDVLLWDAKSGAQVASLAAQPTIVWSLALSPDGKTLVTSGYDGKLLVWSVADRKVLHAVEKKDWIRRVAFAPDGQQFAAALEDGNVVLLETSSAKETKSWQAHEAAVYGLAFSPDGKTLATCSTDKTAKLWDHAAEKPAEKAKLAGHGDAVWAVAWSKDGWLATAGADRQIKLWNAEGKEQATLSGHKDWVTDVVFSPDGKTLASASHDRTARLWDVAQRKETVAFGPHASTAWCVAFSPDGATVAVGTHNTGVRLWKFMKAELFPAASAP